MIAYYVSLDRGPYISEAWRSPHHTDRKTWRQINPDNVYRKDTSKPKPKRKRNAKTHR